MVFFTLALVFFLTLLSFQLVRRGRTLPSKQDCTAKTRSIFIGYNTQSYLLPITPATQVHACWPVPFNALYDRGLTRIVVVALGVSVLRQTRGDPSIRSGSH